MGEEREEEVPARLWVGEQAGQGRDEELEGRGRTEATHHWETIHTWARIANDRSGRVQLLRVQATPTHTYVHTVFVPI